MLCGQAGAPHRAAGSARPALTRQKLPSQNLTGEINTPLTVEGWRADLVNKHEAQDSKPNAANKYK